MCGALEEKRETHDQINKLSGSTRTKNDTPIHSQDLWYILRACSMPRGHDVNITNMLHYSRLRENFASRLCGSKFLVLKLLGSACVTKGRKKGHGWAHLYKVGSGDECNVGFDQVVKRFVTLRCGYSDLCKPFEYADHALPVFNQKGPSLFQHLLVM